MYNILIINLKLVGSCIWDNRERRKKMEVNWCVLYRKSCTYEFWNESHYVDHTKKSQERDMWKLLLKSWCLKYGGWWLYYSFESTLNSISIVHLAFFFFSLMKLWKYLWCFMNIKVKMHLNTVTFEQCYAKFCMRVNMILVTVYISLNVEINQWPKKISDVKR